MSKKTPEHNLITVHYQNLDALDWLYIISFESAAIMLQS